MGLLVLHLSGLVLNVYVTHVSEAGGAGTGGLVRGGRDGTPLVGLPGGEVWGQDLLRSVGKVCPSFNQVSCQVTDTSMIRTCLWDPLSQLL